LKHALIFLCAAIFLNFGEARAQQPGQEKNGPREQPQGEPAGPRGTPRTVREGRGLAADNLERVAAAAEQILEILNRDAGLMVEFKRMIAQDASAIGQLLEESDLTDSALTARINEDLRTRVLATRLLQKYGYLLPKINPESELGQEQKLVLQERAQQLARASERGYEGREPPAAGMNAACDPEQQSGCDAQGRFWQKTRTLSEPGGREALPAEQNPQREEYPMQPSRPENPSSPQMLRTGATEQNAGEYQQASSPAMNLGGNAASAGRSAAGNGWDGAFPPMMSGNEMPSSGNSPGERSMNAAGLRSNADAFERRYAGRGAGDKPFAEIESVRMVHRPNPYADAPSLYDLYVQATWPAQGGATRFGADVFRRGGKDTPCEPACAGPN
jgi:hypothetical protein